ncbi:hypothetical protein C2S52_006365 [Perilla frutescens var. hirtella]|nr:hypothetical protein C2S52_006365 [Perilla frutescens var. hirtella]
MAENTRLKELQEAQKRLDQVWQAESLKRDAAETRLKEQISSVSKMQEGMMNFPKFDGLQPRVWILRCNGYFKMIPNLPDDQKITLDTMNFEGRAATWYQSFSSKPVDLTWSQFVGIVSARFEELREDNVVVEFNKLRHTGDYWTYVDRFKELKDCMTLFGDKAYSEAYFITSFLSGLSEELKVAVKMFNPTTLAQAIELGQNQLISIEAITKKIKAGQRPYPSNVPRNNPQTTAQQFTSAPKLNQPLKAPVKINYMIMTEDEEEFSRLHVTTPQETEIPSGKELEEVQVSLNTIKGDDGITTLRFTGTSHGHSLQVLIDIGSTLSFIKESTAQLLGCGIEETTPLLIKVANGQKLISSSRAENFGWDMQGHHLTHPLRIEVEEVFLLAMQKPSYDRNLELKELIDEFSDIFQEPEGLPPLRGVEHQIILKAGMSTIIPEWVQEVLTSYAEDVLCKDIIAAKHVDPEAYPKFTLTQGILRYKGRVVIGNTQELKAKILTTMHNTPYGGHSGINGTYMRLNEVFYWPGMKHDVEEMVKTCDIFQGIIPLPELPETSPDGVFQLQPVAVLDRRVVHRRRIPVEQVLVQWEGTHSDLQSWEDIKFMKKKFPTMDPWGQGSKNGGGIVMAITPIAGRRSESLLEFEDSGRMELESVIEGKNGGNLATEEETEAKIQFLGIRSNWELRSAELISFE